MHWILLNLAYNASIMAEIPASGFNPDQYEGFEIRNPDGSYTLSGQTLFEYMEGEQLRRMVAAERNPQPAPDTQSMTDIVTTRVLQAIGFPL